MQADGSEHLREVIKTFLEQQAKAGNLMMAFREIFEHREEIHIGRDELTSALALLVHDGILGFYRKGNAKYYYLQHIVDYLRGTQRLL